MPHGFHHEALFYAGEDGFLQGTVPFISEALEADEPVLVALGAVRIESLKLALGDRAQRVHFTDMRRLGLNPARIIPAWQDFLGRHAANGRPVRGIGEPVWPGRGAAELSECRRHESLLNLAFEGGQAWRLLCPYDLEHLDRSTIAAARRNHPFVAQGGESQGSEAYQGTHEAPSPFEGALPAPGAPVEELRFAAEDLAGVRRLVEARARGVLEAVRAEGLVLAVNELATNSARYGGGEGLLAIWREPGVLLCEVRDLGHIGEPLVGRTRPKPDQTSGRGLWLVNQLCDLVQIRSSSGGSVVRLHMRLA